MRCSIFVVVSTMTTTGGGHGKKGVDVSAKKILGHYETSSCMSKSNGLSENRCDGRDAALSHSHKASYYLKKHCSTPFLVDWVGGPKKWNFSTISFISCSSNDIWPVLKLCTVI